MEPREIKAWRALRGMTQTDLAEKLGLSRGAVAWWETGKHEPPPYLDLALAELSRQLEPR